MRWCKSRIFKHDKWNNTAFSLKGTRALGASIIYAMITQYDNLTFYRTPALQHTWLDTVLKSWPGTRCPRSVATIWVFPTLLSGISLCFLGCSQLLNPFPGRKGPSYCIELNDLDMTPLFSVPGIVWKRHSFQFLGWFGNARYLSVLVPDKLLQCWWVLLWFNWHPCNSDWTVLTFWRL